ncbi:NOT2 / NOT3 / NOT5 family protein [Trichinella nativa]|uniref:NOT2 / NOT3 / NOT5 family protein n=1 Tax=Trichinella nativa TaxID=6335 RepID=A0A1Y3EQU2_9BILA|nr:NOT2 / NOT3 / NOT5 family protein [Trichinella nativa]
MSSRFGTLIISTKQYSYPVVVGGAETTIIVVGFFGKEDEACYAYAYTHACFRLKFFLCSRSARQVDYSGFGGGRQFAGGTGGNLNDSKDLNYTFAGQQQQMSNKQQQPMDRANGAGLYGRFCPTGASRSYGDTGYQQPLSLNENDFPSLSSNRSISYGGTTGPAPGHRNAASGGRFSSYNRNSSSLGSGSSRPPHHVQQQESQPEFQIQNEDFPALPGTLDSSSTVVVSLIFTNEGGVKIGWGLVETSGNGPMPPHHGVYLMPDGTVTGLQVGMLRDHFGMGAAAVFFQKLPTMDADLVTLYVGEDLTQVGVDLTSREQNLFPSFAGSLADGPLPCHNMEGDIPEEYLTHSRVCERVLPVKLNRYNEDLLFFMFYTFVGESYQIGAAAELYQRDWRYHKEERIWLTRAPGMVPTEKNATYEQGLYYVFDPLLWRKVLYMWKVAYECLFTTRIKLAFLQFFSVVLPHIFEREVFIYIHLFACC